MRLAAVRAGGASGERIRGKTPSTAKVRRSVTRLLRENVLCSMATVTPDGRPHVNTAYFAWSNELEIDFLSDPRSLHCRNVAANPAMAMAVFSSEQTWGRSDRGLQLFGRCAPASGARAADAQRRYGRRFRDFPRWWSSLGEDDPAREYRFFRFTVRKLKVFDERAFGGAVFVSASVTRRRGR